MNTSGFILPETGTTVYLVGAGGCGMSGLGHILLDMGYKVAGSDLLDCVEVQQLRERGANILKGHEAQHLAAAKPSLVVYSSAIRLENPELKLAQQMQIPIVRRAALLSALVALQRGVCIAGMHGKTTSTALLTFALENLNASPSYAVGALVPQLRRHARFSHGAAAAEEVPLFVVEADESDGTLREFRPDFSIILNIDEEHLDFYANLDAICSTFRQFADQTRQAVIYCADDVRLTTLLAGHQRALSYGFSANAAYRIAIQENSAKPDFNGHFEVWFNNKKLGDFSIGLLGHQNISNAGAVIALLHQLGYAPARIAAAIAGFRGAARRQQELYRDENIRIFDDYGHHPAEIEATLRAFKRLNPRRLLVAFQPHRFTRTHLLLKQFMTCFKDADKLWITEIYAASETAIAGINGALMAKAIQDQGQPVGFIPSLKDLRESVRAAIEPGDVVLFLGAGDITKAAHELAAQFRETNHAAGHRAIS
jgi:UDP-N-acetylmuramate--alanine ligase